MKKISFLFVILVLCNASKAHADEGFSASIFADTWFAGVLHGEPVDETFPLDTLGAPQEPVATQHGFGGAVGATLRLNATFSIEGNALVGVGTLGRTIVGGGGNIGVNIAPKHRLLLGGEGWLETSDTVDGVGATFGPGYLWTPMSWLRVGIHPHVGIMSLVDDIRLQNNEPRGGAEATWFAFAPRFNIGLTYP